MASGSSREGATHLSGLRPQNLSTMDYLTFQKWQRSDGGTGAPSGEMLSVRTGAGTTLQEGVRQLCEEYELDPRRVTMQHLNSLAHTVLDPTTTPVLPIYPAAIISVLVHGQLRLPCKVAPYTPLGRIEAACRQAVPGFPESYFTALGDMCMADAFPQMRWPGTDGRGQDMSIVCGEMEP